MRFVSIAIGTLLLGASAFAQDYVGDQACSGCHANNPVPGFFDGYMRSGHPWKIFRTAGMVPAPDTWPFTVVPPLPMAFGNQLEWSDVEYTIGNYYWKTRYIDRDGYIWTGNANDSTQWNIDTQAFVPYHPGEDRPFNCGRCHTTGYEPEGNQHGLPGLIGTWAQDGVRCEACHGPASEHTGSDGMIAPPGGKDCSECHYRDDDFRMPWSGGFMRHHQQSEDLSHSPHSDELDCSSCHDPHLSVVYQEGGTIAACSDCHEGDITNGFYAVGGMEFVDCKDCHMPAMGKSAVALNAFTGDIRGHIFQIMTEPIAAADNVYEVNGSFFWNQDENGDSSITLDYACLGCHIEFDSLTLAGAADFAENIHTAHAANLVTVALEIKPGACPAPLNPKSKGVTPVAILGSADFDVHQIDVDTLVLEGVAPLRTGYGDVGTPAEGEEPCACGSDDPDGYDDLTMKFKTPDLIAALGALEAGEEYVLTINGNMLDGTPIGGDDCIRIVGKQIAGTSISSLKR